MHSTHRDWIASTHLEDVKLQARRRLLHAEAQANRTNIRLREVEAIRSCEQQPDETPKKAAAPFVTSWLRGDSGLAGLSVGFLIPQFG